MRPPAEWVVPMNIPEPDCDGCRNGLPLNHSGWHEEHGKRDSGRSFPCVRLHPERMLDAELGMRWWNQLREIERAYWLARANSAVPADAWAAFQRETARAIAGRR